FFFDQDKLQFLPLPQAPAANVPRLASWQAPLFPRLKINVDGAFTAGSGGAIGLVVRDSSGGQLFATDIEGGATQVQHVVSARQVFARDGGTIVADILSYLDALPQLRLQ
ncbi:hypothetical protein LINPERHAP1_LOCUS11696, partial [Linum perenne]